MSVSFYIKSLNVGAIFVKSLKNYEILRRNSLTLVFPFASLDDWMLKQPQSLNSVILIVKVAKNNPFG